MFAFVIIQEYGFSKDACRRLFNAPRRNASASSYYHGVVDASVPKKLDNSKGMYDKTFHAHAAVVKHLLELVALHEDDGGGSMSVSGDEMSKQNVGILAVSRSHQLNRLVLNSSKFKVDDHDFPKASG